MSFNKPKNYLMSADRQAFISSINFYLDLEQKKSLTLKKKSKNKKNLLIRLYMIRLEMIGLDMIGLK